MSDSSRIIKSSQRSSSETGVIESNQGILLDAAASFISTVMHCQKNASVPFELTEEEKNAYHAALHFLKREFDHGAVESKLYPKLQSTDSSTEWASPTPNNDAGAGS